MDGFVDRPRKHRQPGLLGDHRPTPAVPAERRARRDGLPRRAGDPELLDVRQRLRAARTTCSSRSTRGACRPTCTWSPSGRRGAVQQPDSCVNDLDQGRPAGVRLTPAAPGLGTGSAPATTRGPTSPTCCTRHNVSWALLRAAGRPARLRRQRRRDRGRLRAGRQGAGTPAIWNPLPSFTDVQHRRPARQHPGPRPASTRPPRTGTLPAVSWIAPSQPDSDHPPANWRPARRT